MKKCELCLYQWQPRRENPKACPYCKRYLKNSSTIQTSEGANSVDKVENDVAQQNTYPLLKITTSSIQTTPKIDTVVAEQSTPLVRKKIVVPFKSTHEIDPNAVRQSNIQRMQRTAIGIEPLSLQMQGMQRYIEAVQVKTQPLPLQMPDTPIETEHAPSDTVEPLDKPVETPSAQPKRKIKVEF